MFVVFLLFALLPNDVTVIIRTTKRQLHAIQEAEKVMVRKRVRSALNPSLDEDEKIFCRKELHDHQTSDMRMCVCL